MQPKNSVFCVMLRPLSVGKLALQARNSTAVSRNEVALETNLMKPTERQMLGQLLLSQHNPFHAPAKQQSMPRTRATAASKGQKQVIATPVASKPKGKQVWRRVFLCGVLGASSSDRHCVCGVVAGPHSQETNC